MMDEFELNVNRLFAGYACSKIAILGIGNELRRDDAVGLAVVDRLSSFFDDPRSLCLTVKTLRKTLQGTSNE